MEDQNIGLGSVLPWMVQEGCGSPAFPCAKPCLQTNNNRGGFEVNAESQPSQLSLAINASNYVPEATHPYFPEQVKLIDENINSHSAVMGDISVGLKKETASFDKHNFAWNVGVAEGMKQVQMLDGLELQSSEACQKRFIIFDQTGSRARVIFHPALVYEFSDILPNTSNTNGLDGKVGEKETIQKILSACASTEWGARLFAYREPVASAHPSFAKIPNTGLEPITLNEGLCGFSMGEESESRMSCNGSSQGCYSQFHEDSRDIDALLYSDYDDDEEVSTGHTPSEVVINNELTNIEDGADVSSNGFSRKRRRCGDLECREQEVDFIPASIEERTSSILRCTSANVCLPPSRSHESNIQPHHNENAVGSECIHNEFCDSASTNSYPRKTSSQSSANKQRGSYNSTLKRPNSSKKSRIKKMKRTLDVLRSVIPAGDCMDTAVVLDVATQYLKSLQLQVKKLEANQNDKYGIIP
ncbi:hypothetical protein SUGI_0635450 [Cryptomeria japonica]|uniref:uncharacterized protein LOC131051060 n=1 Tax=Cryptomeria japonica TaxID=3369 RepID=UPI002414BBF5|nr:uncharacterized protein LOC131051060 [Cryptomeria japonica]XP_057841401.1 uncharacterized protein LOC131051060 [Cryptomeria japonica]XP_057841402.1 uncharacterized protein LOC131051060 [Cryptomeria japonica]GLJ31634.1 hypothetical protein SUGI_0635450 [Cryptomeria japonica]